MKQKISIFASAFVHSSMKCYTLLFILLFTLCAKAQRVYVCSPQIQTLQWVYKGVVTHTPVWPMEGGQPLTFSFDIMGHENLNLRYEIEHCTFTWHQSTLHTSEYLEGIGNSLYIPTGTQSLNTDVLYTHYTLTLPSEDVSFRLSGNYKLHIYLEDSLLCTSHFSVVEPRVNIAAIVTADTDKGHYDRYQQVEVTVNHAELSHLRIPRDDLRLVVVPNGWWPKAVYAPEPSMVQAQGLLWTHHPQLIFEAGNEYRKFEILHTYNPYQGIAHIAWHAPHAHAYLYEDTPRRHYLFDRDFNGRFVVRNEDNRNNDTESQYMVVHFSLKAEPEPKGHYYVVGDFNQYQLNANSRMTYDTATATYTTSLLLKQGYYNYAYAYLPQGGTPIMATLSPIEGSFHQTENEYTIYLYQHRHDRGYDALVGYTLLQTTP